MNFAPFSYLQQTIISSSPLILTTGSFYYVGNSGAVQSAYYYTPTSTIYPYMYVSDLSGSFNSTIKANAGFGFNGTTYTLLVRPDGKMTVLGGYQSYSGSAANNLIQLNSDGTKDTSFNIGSNGLGGAAYTGVLQSDGKVIVGGTFTQYSGSVVNRIARINTNGTVDTAYNIGTGFDSAPRSMDLQTDGKLLVVGQFTTYNNSTALRIARINTNGTLDTTFKTGAGLNGNGFAVKQQGDGKVIAGGGFTQYSGSTRGNIVRINTDGTVDSTFNVGAGTNNNVFGIVCSGSTNPRVVIAGTFTSYSGSVANRIAVLNSDGTIDTNFNVGTGFDNNVNGLAIEPNGKLLATGIFQNYNGSPALGVARINPDGTLDDTLKIPGGFYNNSTVSPPTISGSQLYFGGAISSQYIPFATAFDSSGNYSSASYASPISKFNATVFAGIKLTESSDLLLAGNFTAYGVDTTTITGLSGSAPNRIIRINNSGSINSSFNPGQGFNANVFALSERADGKILAGGDFTTYSGSLESRVIRLNSNGTKDTTFSAGTAGANNGVRYVRPLTNGKILLGGDFTQYSGSSTIPGLANAFVNRIIRLNDNGSIDSTFNPGTGSDGTHFAFAEQSNGAVISVGNFTTYSGSTANRIVRINTNGTRDTSFIGSANNTIYSIKTLPNGFSLVAGSFTTFNNVSASMIVRINSSGALDPTFTTSTTASLLNVRAIEVLSDGKILLGGGFAYYSSTFTSGSYGTSPTLMRLNASGTVDTSFSAQGVGAIVYTILPFTASFYT